MNDKPSYLSFPRKDTVEEPSYRRRPVSKEANTNFERHHFQSLRFPFPESHAEVPDSGNPIPLSAISAPSAVNASNLTGKNAKPTMNESHERSPADTPRPAKPCETNREKRRGKFDRGEVFSNCLTTRHLSDAYARYGFKTPGRTGRNERDKLRTGGKRERSGRVPNCLIVSDCLTPYSDPSFPRRRESRILPRDLRALCGESRCRNTGAGIHPFQPATIWRHNGIDGA